MADPDERLRVWRWFIGEPDTTQGRRWRVYGGTSPAATDYGFDCWNHAMKVALSYAGQPTRGIFNGCQNPTCQMLAAANSFRASLQPSGYFAGRIG